MTDWGAEKAPWASRLAELASLPAGWNDDDPDSKPISDLALHGARKVLVHAQRNGKQQPGIFPEVSGGVSIEWASAECVASIEVSPDAKFFLFSLGPDDEVFSIEMADTPEVESFIERV